MPGKLEWNKSVSLPRLCERIREKMLLQTKRVLAKCEAVQSAKYLCKLHERFLFTARLSPQVATVWVTRNLPRCLLSLTFAVWHLREVRRNGFISGEKYSALEISPYRWCLKLFSSHPQTLTHTYMVCSLGSSLSTVMCKVRHTPTHVKMQIGIHICNLTYIMPLFISVCSSFLVFIY